MTPKKLLVLDVNGLLVDTYFHKEPLPEQSPDARVGNFYVYKRPFCDEFLHFCLDNFTVGVWSSAREHNVNNLVDYVFGDTKENLAFSWHQSDCTDVGLKAPDNQWKPLFLKELSKLWRKAKVDLPWGEGDYGPSNTLLVDDTPYKAILNPPNTAIFPRSYTARDHGDNFLGGSLRNYLEGIRDAASVQTYVESNPFGEPSITPESPLWSYVGEVLLKVQSVLNKVGDDIAQVMPVEAVSEEVNKRDKHKRVRHRKRKHFSDPSQLENHHPQSSDDFPSEAVELQSSENMLQPLRSGVQSYKPTQQDKAAASMDSQETVVLSLDGTDQVNTISSQSVFLNQPSKDESPVGSSSLKRKRELSKGFHAVEQAQKQPQNKENSLPAGRQKAYKELSEDEQLEDYDRAGRKQSKNTGFSSYLEQAATGTWGDSKAADKEHVEGKQPDNVDHNTFDKGIHKKGLHHKLDAGVDGNLHILQKQHRDDNNLCDGNDEFKELCIPVCDSSLDPLKSDRMQLEDNGKDFLCRRQETITPGDNCYVRMSDNNGTSEYNFTYSDGNRFKHRRPQGDHIRSRNRKSDSIRDSFSNGQEWKRRDKSNRDSFSYGQDWKRKNDSIRDSFSYGQDWKRKRGYHQDGATKMPPFKGRDGGRHHSVYNQHPTYADNQHPTYVDRRNAGRGYPDRDQPSFGFGRHSQQMWGDRPIDAPAEYAWGASLPDSRSWDESQLECRQFSNTMASANARFGALDTAVSTLPYKSERGISTRVPKHDGFGKLEGGGSSSYLGHHRFEQRTVYERSSIWPEITQPQVEAGGSSSYRGFEQRAAYESSNVWPERTEQSNVHSPDSNPAVKPHVRWDHLNGKRRRFDFADREAGASSQLQRNVVAFSQPYRAEVRASTQPYRNVEALKQPYHNSWDKHRQGWPSSEFSRKRQSQEGRNL